MQIPSPITKDHSWRVVIAAELSPGKNWDHTINLDKSSFNDLFSILKPSLNFYVKDCCRCDTKHLDLSLSFSCMSDFAPDALVQQIPELQWLLDLKKQIRSYQEGEIDSESLSASICNTPLPESVASKLSSLPGIDAYQNSGHSENFSSSKHNQDSANKGTVDAILSMMDPTLPPPSDTKEQGTTITQSSTTQSGMDGTIQGRITSIFDTIDSVIGMQMDEILHHSEFKALETAWRELKFLFGNTDNRAGIAIEVVNCAKNVLDKTLLEVVFKPVWNSGVPGPDVVASLHSFSSNRPDYEQAQNLGQLGIATQTLMVLPAAPQFFGVSQYQSLRSSVPSFQMLLDGCGYETWRDLRNRDEANWLILGANSFYLRPAYGMGGKKVKTFHYSEQHKPQDIPCGSSSAVIISLIAGLIASFKSDSLNHLTRKAQLTDISALHSYTDPGSDAMQVCVTTLTYSKAGEIADAGLCPVNSAPGTLSVTLEGIKTYGKSNYSIPSLLLAGHISRLCTLIILNTRELSCSEVSDELIASINNLILGTAMVGDKQVTTAQVTENGNNGRNVIINVSVPYAIWGEEVEINLSLEL
ncbi:type VI secretion system contractile sheath large subunit [Chitinispirillales bacterium ANBcel5]|uniref:type VI secretion system contractile sheath domain-containing protein n=1 Tax=Cellulosispirillum alkaliphilum TaxID=3039283 RepID=UPI002A552BE9|nr:type VI secretion system contractile sheath large subunit [Chitinispirillales bacterium ANBcel5]